MNAISAQNLFLNHEFYEPCDLDNGYITKAWRMRTLLETLLKPENAAACELDADETSDFSSLQKVILTGLKAVEMLGDSEVFYAPMMATWKAMSETIDEMLESYDALNAAYEALRAAERQFMEDAF